MDLFGTSCGWEKRVGKNMSYYGDQWYSMVLLLRFFLEGEEVFLDLEFEVF